MKILIAAFTVSALIFGQSQFVALAQNAPGDICGDAFYGLNNAFHRDPGAGFIDNDGKHLPYVTVTFQQRCDGKVINVAFELPNGRPIETCDECRAVWEVVKASEESVDWLN